MEKDDEEITIDFGKIKGFFSRKKPDEDKREQVKEIEEEITETEKDIKEEIKEEKEEIKELKEEKVELEEAEEKIEEQIEKKKEKIEVLKEEREDLEEAKEKVRDAEELTKTEPEEEIAIDFSKITRFFKREPKAQDTKKPKEGDEEDISLDFTKIKKFFKGKKAPQEETSEDEISFDWRSIYRFFVKYQLVFLILIPFLVSVNLRMYPAHLPVTDEWATNSVHNYFKSQVKQQIDQQYPNLPDANKQQFVDSEFQNFLTEQKEMVDQQIQGTSEYFKSRLRDENGQTYLLAIDPYFWWRHAKNILDHGYPGDKIVNGEQIDDHMIAPLGRVVPGDMFHAYLEAFAFRFLHFFNSDLDLMKVCFLMPVVLASLSVIPAFFIARRFGGSFGGFVAATIVAIHPAFLSRTAGGFSDTDSYNVLLPLLITWLFLEALESRDLKKMLSLSAVAGFLVGIYSFAWGGWWFVFDFILASVFLYFIYYLVIRRKELSKGIRHVVGLPVVKNLLLVVAVFFVASLIFVSAFQSFNGFKASFRNPQGFSEIKDVATTKVWPNVFTTVAEQNEVTFDSIISNIGGTFLFMLAIFGILVAAFIKSVDGKYDIKYALLLAIWFVCTIYASTKGVRWVLLLVPAFAIAIGVAAGFIYRTFYKWISREFGVNKIVSGLVVLILLLFIVFIYPRNLVSAAQGTARTEIPSMNDAWYASLDMINQNASQDAIINSWWDFGHWFKAIGDRPVTFDGTSQNSPMAHWIGKVLLTDDEHLAVGILQMLDCGSNKAFEELDKVISKPYKTVEILYDIVVQDRNGALETLRGYGLTPQQAEIVLHYTHCDPPENYFIASEDMIGKSGVWSHFGSWDFRKATIFNRIRNLAQEEAVAYLQTEFDYPADEARSLYFEVKSLGVGRAANDWIAPWPSYASNLAGCDLKDSTLQCANGLQVDMNTYDAFLLTQAGKKHPQELVIPTLDGLFRKKFQNDTIEFSAALIPSGNSYVSILMHPDLAASIFTRMFFMDGHGLRHFKPFTYQKSVFGNEIYVYKVDWEGGELNVMETLVEQLKANEERHVRHILVNSSEQAEEILMQLRQGTDFASLAENFSLDTSAANGGDIGWIRLGETVEPFEQAAFDLDVGEVSGVVQTEFGYHIIQLLDLRNQTIAPEISVS